MRRLFLLMTVAPVCALAQTVAPQPRLGVSSDVTAACGGQCYNVDSRTAGAAASALTTAQGAAATAAGASAAATTAQGTATSAQATAAAAQAAALAAKTSAAANAVNLATQVQKEASDTAALKAMIPVPSTSGLFSGTDSTGKTWVVQGQALSSTLALAADSAVVATTSDGSTFSFAASGKNNGSISASGGVVSLIQPAHANSTNQTWIVAPLLSGAYCYTAQIVNPTSNSNYNAGMGLWNKTSGNSAIVEGLYSNGGGTGIIVNTQTSFQGANSNQLNAAYNQPYPTNSAFFERICPDGNGNITVATSASGVASSWTSYTGTASAFGSPGYLGLYVDANPSGGQNYPGSLAVQSFAVTAGYTPTAAVANPDLTQTYLTTVNTPTNDTLPTIAGLVPGDNIALTSGYTELAGVIFGTNVPNANITTNQQVLSTFWTTFAEGPNSFTNGSANSAMGSPVDTGQGDNTTFAGVARTYAASDPNSVHQVRSDGLYLLNNCSRNHTYCYPGLVYGGMISPSFSFKPGMTLKIRAQTGPGPNKWTPLWAFSFARQNSGSVFIPCDNGGNGPCYELDFNDWFARPDGGTAVGQEIIPWTPQFGQYDSNITITTPAYRAFMANTASFTDVQKNEEYEQANNFNCSTAYCDFFINWESAVAVAGVPTSHYIDVFVAPVTSPATKAALITRLYMEYNPSNSGPNGTALGEGIYLSAAQAIPGASLNGGNLPNYAAISENDGISSGSIPGWALKVQEFYAFQGDVVNPTSYEPTN